MKKIIIMALVTLTVSLVSAQEEAPTSFNLSGFKVNIIPSDEFRIEYDESLGIEEKIENKLVKLKVLDQTGRVPKGEVSIYTNHIDKLYLHNCAINCKIPVLSDEFYMELMTTTGDIELDCKKIKFNINSSQINLTGKTQIADCNVGAGAQVNASRFVADEGSVHVLGHALLVANIKKVSSEIVENGNFTNKTE